MEKPKEDIHIPKDEIEKPGEDQTEDRPEDVVENLGVEQTENKPEGEDNEVKRDIKPELPNLEYLDKLLEEADSVLKSAMQSSADIDELIEKHKVTKERIDNIDVLRESRLRRVEDFDPFGRLKSDDYERLVRERVIKKDIAESLKVIDEMITEFESIEYPEAYVVEKFEKVYQEQRILRDYTESKIREREDKKATQRERLISRVVDHYGNRIQELEQVIAEIESDPAVMERLKLMDEEKKKEFEEKMEKERELILKEASRYTQSLGARHENAFTRIGEIAGNEGIADELMGALDEEDLKKRRSVFQSVRDKLKNAIIDGEDEKQILTPQEVVPWMGRASSIDYRGALEFLKSPETFKTLQKAADEGDENARQLLEKRDWIIKGNTAFRALVGAKYYTDKKTQQKKKGDFWHAFEVREYNDSKGITLKRKEEREENERRRAEKEKEIQEIVGRGGFVVKVPLYKKLGNKKIKYGTTKGAVKINKELSKRSNEYLKVEEVSSNIEDVIRVGSSSPLDLSSYPDCIRDSAREAGITF